MRLPRLAVCVAISVLASACVSTPTEVDELLARAVQTAGSLHERELYPEAALFLEVIEVVDPEYPGLREIDSDLDPAVRERMHRDALGMNRSMRPPVERSFRAKALLYLPDRLLDLMDVVSFGVHFGIGAFADAHATRVLQVAAGFHSSGGVGVHEQRSLGIKSQSEAGLTLVAVGASSFTTGLMGTSGRRGGADDFAGLHKPDMPAYQTVRDYWAIGANATAGIVGAEVEFHPLQLADFLAGWVGVDFLHDDWARTRSLDLGRSEQLLLGDLWRLRGSPKAIEAYQRSEDPLRDWQPPAAPTRQ